MFKIRLATPDDCPLIHEMGCRVFPQTYKDLIDEEQLKFMMEWMYSVPNLHEQIERQGHVYLLAFDETGEPAGYCSVQRLDDDVCEMHRLYVLPQWQKHHLGRQLFLGAIDFIRDQYPECSMMELRVKRDNSAVTFYEHMGMRRLREDDLHIGNGFYMRDYIMGIDLKDKEGV